MLNYVPLWDINILLNQLALIFKSLCKIRSKGISTSEKKYIPSNPGVYHQWYLDSDASRKVQEPQSRQ